MKPITLLIASLFVALVAFAESPKKKETKAAAPTTEFLPIRHIHAHVCGIHFYRGDMGRPNAKVDPSADGWQTADTVQLDLKTIASMSKAVETPQEKPKEE